MSVIMAGASVSCIGPGLPIPTGSGPGIAPLTPYSLRSIQATLGPIQGLDHVVLRYHLFHRV